MIPERLQIKNFQSYSEADVNFDFNSALIIGERDNNSDVSNGAGKSAIFEAIGWALFGKSRQKNVDDVVKRGEDLCEVDFTFSHNSERYRVFRRRNVRFGRWDVSFYKYNGNTEIQIGGDTNTDINEAIKETIKSNYEVFLNSCYFRQNSISDFLEGTTADRQKLISSILNLDRWNKYAKNAKDLLSDWKIKEEKIEYRLRDFVNLDSIFSEAQASLESSEKRLRDIKNQEEKTSSEVLSIESKLSSMRMEQKDLEDYHDTVSRYDISSQKLIEFKQACDEKNREISFLNDKLLAGKQTVNELSNKILEISSHISLKDKVDLLPLEQELSAKRTEKTMLLQQVNEFDGSGICPCCGNLWNTHEDKMQEIFDKQARSVILSKDIVRLEDKVEVARDILKKIKESEIEIEKYTGRKMALESNIEIHQLKLEVAQSDLVKVRKDLNDEEERNTFLREKLDGMKDIISSNTYENLRLLLKEKKDLKDKLIDDKTNIMYDVGALTEKVSECRNNTTIRNNLSAELLGVQREIVIYESLLRIFGRTGIQAIIVDNVVDELTRVANYWLNEFAYEPVYINFVTQKKDSKGSWKETLDIEVITPSGPCSFESLSGGEAFRVAFAIILALGHIQARRMGGENQLLLLDEVSTSLDSHGLSMFVSIIRKLERSVKVMVVTHDDKLKEEFEHVIKVRKIKNDSTLTY